MAPTIASPVPLRFDQAQQIENDLQHKEHGRETPLPRYEKTQSVPFTLDLQEDVRNPGHFQLVVNVNSKHQNLDGISLSPAPAVRALSSENHLAKFPTNASTLYQTQKSSPPTSPSEDKQGWSDLDTVPHDFLQKVVPDWNITFSRSDSTASTQSKRLADIKARIKKKGRGYVVRLLKGSALDLNEVAEVDLGQQQIADESTKPHELDSSGTPTELDSLQTVAPPTTDSVLGRPDVFEIGSSDEPGVKQNNRLSRTAVDLRSIATIVEESLSDAETLIPDIRSISGQIHEEETDSEPSTRTSTLFHPNRSDSVSSIVKTPTRGLSLVGPVRRVDKPVRKTRTTALELNRSDAHKSTKRRSPRNSTSNLATDKLLEERVETPKLREQTRGPFLLPADDDVVVSNEISTCQYPVRETHANRPQHPRRLSADGLLAPHSRPLKLRTNIPYSKSSNTSPVARRKRSPKIHKFISCSSSPTSSENSPERLDAPPVGSDIESSREFLEAVNIALRAAGKNSKDSDKTLEERHLPRIIEPANEGRVGEILFPAEAEIGYNRPVGRSPTLTYWGLAISALSDKVYEVFKLLRDTYGSEPPVPQGHVRVRWTCSCGESLFDDFIEKRPNAARLLEAYLNRPTTHTPRSPTSQSSTASSMDSIFDASSRATTLTTPSSTYGGPSSWGRNTDASKYSPSRLRTNSPYSVRMPTYAEESWLLTCTNEGRFTPKIVHLDVNEGRIKSDKDLALSLREHYDQLNRRWFNWARLRGLTTIEFVQFEVHRNRFADIRAAPSMPPTSVLSSTSSSNLEKSNAPSNHPYNFEAIDLLPPVGSTYLLHLFKHPSDYDGELITYLRSPKRRLRLETGMGWGVHLVEGFLAQKVWAVTMSICALASAAFAIMWTVTKNDVQGAFGVAQWVLGLAALLVGGLQAWLE